MVIVNFTARKPRCVSHGTTVFWTGYNYACRENVMTPYGGSAGPCQSKLVDFVLNLNFRGNIWVNLR